MNVFAERYLERADFAGRWGHRRVRSFVVRHIGLLLELVSTSDLRQDLDRSEECLGGASVRPSVQIGAKAVEIIFLLLLLLLFCRRFILHLINEHLV